MPTVVLVEDNEMNRDMLTRRLARRGWRVEVAVDGEDALRVVARVLPDIVLMDMGLPVLDGWEATRRLKADPATAHLPVVALTAHAMSTDRDAALAAGCDDYETKPIDLERLLGVMQRLVGPQAISAGNGA